MSVVASRFGKTGSIVKMRVSISKEDLFAEVAGGGVPFFGEVRRDGVVEMDGDFFWCRGLRSGEFRDGDWLN